MRFGVSWVPDASPEYWAAIAASEAAGFERIGVPDSQAGEYRECYSVLTRVLDRTTKAQAGPLATNPLTRHPAVTAAAIATADQASGGRTFLCLATGDTGVLNLGLRPARLAVLERYLTTVRTLLTTGKAEHDGAGISLRWAGRSVPILIAADGPRALRMTGRIADGVVIGMGLTPEVVRNARAILSAGAAEAGRSIEDLQVWWMARCAIESTREAAVEIVLPSLAAAAAHAFRGSLEGKAVPEELEQALAKLVAGYEVRSHNMRTAENPNSALVKELGLEEFLVNRMGIVGTENECRSRLLELRDLGVENIIVRPLAADRMRFLESWKRVVTHEQISG